MRTFLIWFGAVWFVLAWLMLLSLALVARRRAPLPELPASSGRRSVASPRPPSAVPPDVSSEIPVNEASAPVPDRAPA